MKRKLIALTFMLSLFQFCTTGIKAQNDAFFVKATEHRTFINEGQGFNFGNMDPQQSGLNFEKMNSGDAPVGNGLLIMTATGLIYFMNKRRKENE